MTETVNMVAPVPAPAPRPAGPLPPLEVKRYANRKIYVPELRAYVNLPSLYETLLSGRDIVVTCAATKRDVTSKVLGLIYQEMCVNSGHVAQQELVASIRAYGPAPIAT